MPLAKLQSHVLKLLASRRSPDSYVAEGVALNRSGPRYSRDIDIFQDSEARLEAAAAADSEALRDAGLGFDWVQLFAGKREAEIEGLGERMRLEWVHDSAFRFFPAQKDDLFGYVLHPADLATNKVSAAADRREPRDIVDLVTIHNSILSLGAAVCAAVGRFPGQTPEQMLGDIKRHSRFTAQEFESLSTELPIEIESISARIRAMLADAEEFIGRLPSEAVGVLFLLNGKPVQPNLDELGSYERLAGAPSGIWPSSSDISKQMLLSYKERDL